MQGCTITETRDSNSPSGQLFTSQVFFAASEPNKSVSLSLVRDYPGAESKRAAKKFWHETFDRYASPEAEREEEEKKKANAAATESKEGKPGEEEERHTPPQRVEGLGDEAYWTPNNAGSALYVLKGDAFIRLSVGGTDSQEIKLQKSKALAEKALGRL